MSRKPPELTEDGIAANKESFTDQLSVSYGIFMFPFLVLLFG